MGDTRTPLRFAVIRVALTIAMGFPAALLGPSLFDLDPRWGAVGLTATAGIAGWVEYALLRRRLAAIIGPSNLGARYLVRLYVAALSAAAIGWAILLAIGGPEQRPVLVALAVLLPFALTYGLLTWYFRIPTAVGIAGRILRRA